MNAKDRRNLEGCSEASRDIKGILEALLVISRNPVVMAQAQAARSHSTRPRFSLIS